jgi:hypothetical protein
MKIKLVPENEKLVLSMIEWKLRRRFDRQLGEAEIPVDG